MTAGGMSVVEPWIRVGAFAAVFALVAAWEALAPRRGPNNSPKHLRKEHA
jgi:hypothetical protein